MMIFTFKTHVQAKKYHITIYIAVRDSLIENIEMNQNGNVSDDEEREVG